MTFSNRKLKAAIEYRPAGEPGPSLPKLSKAEAKARYTAFSNNHPTIHCNRFAPWEELSKAEQRKWRDPAYKG